MKIWQLSTATHAKVTQEAFKPSSKQQSTLTINSLQEFKHLALSDDLDADSLIFGLFVAVTDRHIDQT